ncbi:hypothetical protein FA13DRAFT_1720440 [Coprinellus micaceus]|uniref:Uncharacterized protein n=1 Tax=Coprinellus micaceus TaxID=71717 RepID=A0A4Y7SA38_COPMI|nr:hypothetical protein FA13DRAFT_1720440 [Coprinellus micaceus]
MLQVVEEDPKSPPNTPRTTKTVNWGSFASSASSAGNIGNPPANSCASSNNPQASCRQERPKKGSIKASEGSQGFQTFAGLRASTCSDSPPELKCPRSLQIHSGKDAERKIVQAPDPPRGLLCQFHNLLRQIPSAQLRPDEKPLKTRTPSPAKSRDILKGSGTSYRLLSERVNMFFPSPIKLSQDVLHAATHAPVGHSAMSTLVHCSPSKPLRGSSSRKQPCRGQGSGWRAQVWRSQNKIPESQEEDLSLPRVKLPMRRRNVAGPVVVKNPFKSHLSGQRDPSRGKEASSGTPPSWRLNQIKVPRHPSAPHAGTPSTKKKSPDVWGNADDEFFTSVRKGKERAYSLGPHITDTNSSEGVEEWAYEDDLGAGMDEDGDVGFDEEEDNMILAMSKSIQGPEVRISNNPPPEGTETKGDPQESEVTD